MPEFKCSFSSINTYIDISTKAEIEKRKNNASANPPTPEQKLSTEQQIIKSIEGMETISQLEIYKKSALKNPKIQAAYDLQLLKLKK